jgi:hypothetical protein
MATIAREFIQQGIEQSIEQGAEQGLEKASGGFCCGALAKYRKGLPNI